MPERRPADEHVVGPLKNDLVQTRANTHVGARRRRARNRHRKRWRRRLDRRRPLAGGAAARGVAIAAWPSWTPTARSRRSPASSKKLRSSATSSGSRAAGGCAPATASSAPGARPPPASRRSAARGTRASRQAAAGSAAAARGNRRGAATAPPPPAPPLKSACARLPPRIRASCNCTRAERSRRRRVGDRAVEGSAHHAAACPTAEPSSVGAGARVRGGGRRRRQRPGRRWWRRRRHAGERRGDPRSTACRCHRRRRRRGAGRRRPAHVARLRRRAQWTSVGAGLAFFESGCARRQEEQQLGEFGDAVRARSPGSALPFTRTAGGGGWRLVDRLATASWPCLFGAARDREDDEHGRPAVDGRRPARPRGRSRAWPRERGVAHRSRALFTARAGEHASDCSCCVGLPQGFPPTSLRPINARTLREGAPPPPAAREAPLGDALV